MNVGDAIRLLQNAELKQLAVGKDKEAVRGFINLGILEIYKRVTLLQDEAIITMAMDTRYYTLDGLDPNVQINLSDKDFLLVEEVYDNDGYRLSLNNEDDLQGVNTPAYNQIEIPAVLPGDIMSVTYRAAPKFLDHEKADIPLPPQFFEALFHYVGYRAHGSIKGDLQRDTSSHYNRFEASIKQVKADGLYTPDSLKSDKFEKRGFV